MPSDPPVTPRRARPLRVTFPLAGVTVAAMTEHQVVDHVVDACRRGEGGLLVTPNVDHLRQIAAGSWLGAVYAEADLAVADGMPLIWASQLLGQPLPERVAGADLLGLLTEAAAAHGLSIYLLGGSPGAADEAAARFTRRWPALKIAGVSCPPRGFERERGGLERLCTEVAATDPALVFTALGAPKQEYVNLALRSRLPRAWCLGVGAAVDMAAGHVRRAPEWAQRAGVEWLYRLAQEPGRMARRYLVEDAPFAARLLGAAALEGRARRSGR